LVEQALIMDGEVRDAVAENSLNAQDIESTIRKSLLPMLFDTLGLAAAKSVIEEVIQITRVGLNKH
jgi:type I restriction enzyme, R subunit